MFMPRGDLKWAKTRESSKIYFTVTIQYYIQMVTFSIGFPFDYNPEAMRVQNALVFLIIMRIAKAKQFTAA